ncbi:MAG: alpha/beta hydrolase [Alphaproteobacteria bacterium]|nr:alpha/beta hydrolase [Alphaproteobacteria bacterium]
MPHQTKLIMALHGAGMQAGVWGSLIGGLALPCQAVSFPGHGRTEGALLPSIEKMAEWAGTRLADHPPQSVVLMGHSMGALAALEAARHPAVAALVLMGAVAKMPVHPELLHQAGADPDTAVDMILKWGVSPVHPQAAAVRAVLKEQMKTTAPGALLSDLKACHAYQRGEAAAQEIRQPVLILSGLDDKLTRSAEGQALAGMIPAAQFHVLPDCGHMPMVEKPAETASGINVFIEGLAG